jgi:hypothetical protein
MSIRGSRPRTRDVFRGPRLVVRVAPLLRARSAVLLAVVSLAIGAVVAAALTAVVLELQSLIHSFGTSS